MAAALAIVLLPMATVIAPAPAGAEEGPFTLTMESGTGVVLLPNIEEPLLIEDPTTVTGTLDGGFDGTGVVGDVHLSTPAISFQTEAEGLVVDVDAVFSQSSPGSGVVVTQSDGTASVAVDVAVTLTLHINVGGGGLLNRCVTSQPINLVLRSGSDTPYDPDTGVVTVSDANFTIPPVAVTEECISIVAGTVNAQLAASGNSITLTLAGDLDLPPMPGEPTVTTVVSTVDTTSLGQPATFTATVAAGEDAEAEEDPTGDVVFFIDGDQSIGRSALNASQQATLTTSALPLGAHAVTARYLGDPVFSPSQSAPLAHTVTAVPSLAAVFPAQIVAGGVEAASEFTATITNPAAGTAMANLRMDFTFGPLSSMANGHLVLQHEASPDNWETIALTGTTVQTGSYGGLTGFSLPAGQTEEIQFRIYGITNARQGPLPVQIALNTVDGTGEVVSTLDTKTADSFVVPATRRATSVSLSVGSGFTNPPTARQGYSANVRATITRTGAPSPFPPLVGVAQLFVNGQLTPAMPSELSDASAVDSQVPGSTGVVNFFLPRSFTASLAPGTYPYQVRFLGDAIYAPSISAEQTLTILAQPTENPYLCTTVTPIGASPVGASFDVQGDLPPLAVAGTQVSIGRPTIQMIMESTRGALLANFFGNPAFPEQSTGIDLAGQTGGGTFDSFTVTGSNGVLEQTVAYGGIDTAIPIEGQPGDVVDVTMNSIGFTLTGGTISLVLSCIPAGGAAPVSFGQLTVAGTVLSADTPAAVVGDAVALTADVFPETAQGFVEFFDVEGETETSLGIAPVTDGTATLRTRNLPEGERQVVARHLGDLVQPPTTSEPVTVSVRAIECEDFAEAGNGAVVRLVYLELLRRCPDQAGFDFWVSRLNTGTSPEVFARSIASTPEAVGVVVNDGYQTMLGRNAEPAGKAFWVDRMIGGTGRYDQLLADLGASDEFWSKAGSTNTGFVERVYDRLLHRSPDQAGSDYWVTRLDDGDPRRVLILSLANLDEPLGVLATQSYGAMLDRAPDDAERAAAITHLRATGDRSGLYAQLIGRPEFATRAQGFPNP